MKAATVLSVTVAVQHGEQLKSVEIAGAFDPIRSPEAARATGRAIGELVSENLERRMRFGEDLTKGMAA